jgi:hypothetical protein
MTFATTNNVLFFPGLGGRSGGEIESARQGLLALAAPDRIETGPNCVTVHDVSGTGFNVSLLRTQSHWVVFFDGWHDEFQDLPSALRLCAEALAGDLRLRVDLSGGKPWRWTVERQAGEGRWVQLHSNAVFMLGRGQPRGAMYYRNGPAS